MARLRLLLSIVCLLGLASAGHAGGVIAYDCGYAKAGSTCGEIAVKGAITFDMGSKLVGTTVTVSAWQNGNVVATTTLTVSSNTFNGVIGGLESGKSYNVTVEATITEVMNQVIRTDAVAVTAP